MRSNNAQHSRECHRHVFAARAVSKIRPADACMQMWRIRLGWGGGVRAACTHRASHCSHMCSGAQRSPLMCLCVCVCACPSALLEHLRRGLCSIILTSAGFLVAHRMHMCLWSSRCVASVLCPVFGGALILMPFACWLGGPLAFSALQAFLRRCAGGGGSSPTGVGDSKCRGLS